MIWIVRGWSASDRTPRGLRVACRAKGGREADARRRRRPRREGDRPEQDRTITVKLSNTSAYSHWFVGTILKPEKLLMEVKPVPYKDGIIVDATTRVKLEQIEDRAPKLTRSITSIFDWLKRTAR